MADSDAFHIAVGIPQPPDIDDADFASGLMLVDSDERVTLKCGKKVFKFSKPKLVKDSEYFRACLNKSNFVEGRTSVIEFDDIEPELLETYLEIVDVTDTCDPIDVEDFLVSSEWDNEAMDDIIPMIEMYRLSDRFMNESIRVKLSQSILECMQKGTVTKVNKSLPEGIKWLYNTYKIAYDTLDPSIADEANLQSEIAKVCCQQIDMDKTYALARTTPESEAFLEAVLMATTQRMATLLQQTRSLSTKVERLETENRIFTGIGYLRYYTDLVEAFSYSYHDQMHDGDSISRDSEGDDDEEDGEDDGDGEGDEYDEDNEDDEDEEDDDDGDDDEDGDCGEDGVRRDH